MKRHRGSTGGGARLAIALLLGSFWVAPGAAAQAVAPLYNWYSTSRGDNFATTDPQWSGRPGQTRSPDYRFVRIEGTLFSPDAPQPSGTDSVYSWYHPGRGDNFLTTDPRWAGRPGQVRDGYRFVRFEGYIHDAPRAGTMPLQSFWDPGRADNFATTDPRWIGKVGDRREPGYSLYRTEGFLGPPATPQPPDLAPDVGYRGKPVRGVRPLLVVITDFPDASVPQSMGYFDSLFFGPSYPNIRDYYTAVSANQFTWRRAGILRVRFSDQFAVAGANAAAFDQQVTRLAAAEFNIAQFDANEDGTVSDTELGMLVVNPGAGSGGQTRNRSVTISGRRFSGKVSYTTANGDITLYAHELFHQIGFEEHLYGPGGRLNFRATLHATPGSVTSPAGPMQLDPWHRSLAGWLHPRVLPITEAARSVTIGAAEPLPTGNLAPVVLYDPARGFNEFFFIEYRTPNGPSTRGGGYDARVLGQGVAVWYVRRKSPTELFPFNWPPPIRGPFSGGAAHAYANYLVGPAGPGNGPFWQSSNGEFPLAWGDGTDSKLRVRVGPLDSIAGMARVQWRHADHPFAPRIDGAMATTVRASPAHVVLSLDGEFPVDGSNLAVVVSSDTRQTRLTLLTIASTRLTARSSGSLPAGMYTVTVEDRRSPRGLSNGLRINILP